MKINSKTQKPMAIAEAYEAFANKANSNDAAKMITESWSPMITRTTGVTDENKLAWISQLAHNTAKSLNESGSNTTMDGNTNIAGFGGVYTPYNTLYNTLGVGNVVPAQRAALTATQQANDQYNGSGDKFPGLVPLAIKVAAKTVGFELVNNIPMQGPAGCLPYMDYVYSGSKQPYGATPAYNKENANIKLFHGKNAYELYDLPSAFKAGYDKKAGVDTSFNNVPAGTTLATDGSTLIVEYAGKSRIDGDPMFKVISGTQSLGATYADSSVKLTGSVNGTAVTFYTNAPRLISMQEDQVLGFTGAGPKDADAWTGTFQDGTQMYEPMSRGTGEMTAPRQISLRLFTKNIQVGTIQVGCGVTQEQVTDLQKQWGIDVIKVVENAGIAELSQTINRHITSRLFGLGWKNALKLYEVEGANLNLTFNQNRTEPTLEYAYPSGQWLEQENGYEKTLNESMPFQKFNVVASASFENRDTLIKRIYTNILAASNWIQQRGRYGAANFAVTNITLATLLQSGAHYTFSPMENSVNQGAGQLYPIGKICGITVYVDPLMSAQDNRILVGRKGDKDEPGTYFCPYVMAEVVRTIAEGTGAPKLYIKSRYALVDAGFFPETQYFTFVVDVDSL